MVPEGWKLEALSDAVKVIDCKHRTPKYVDSGIPLISPGTIKWGALDLNSPVKRVSESEYESLMDHCTVDIGDLVMSRNQSLGIASYVESHEPFVLGQDTVLIKPITANIKFIFYKLQSDTVQKNIIKLAGGSTFSRINLADIRKLKVSLPPISQQKKIAQILSTWDKAITITEQLLTNSQQQKKALMQQLLTGKKRLLDENSVRFSGEWESFTLNELFTFKRGKGLSKGDISKTGKNRCVLYGELYTCYAEVIENVYSRTDKDEAELSESGDILIPSSTTTSGIDLANATAILENGVLLGSDINILRPRSELSSQFMAHVLTHVKRYEIASMAQGITIIHLYGSDLKKLKVSIPVKLEEQIKISQVLSSIDKELQQLQIKLEILRNEKKALMQQLLTGKRRVEVDEDAA